MPRMIARHDRAIYPAALASHTAGIIRVWLTIFACQPT